MADKRHNNLIPQAHVLTVDEQSKGGNKSAEVRKERKKAREIAELVLSMPLSNDRMQSLDDLDTLSEVDNVDTLTALIVNAVKKALDGSYKHLELVLTLTGDYSSRMKLEMPQIRDASADKLFEDMKYKLDIEKDTEHNAKTHIWTSVNALSFAMKSTEERPRILKNFKTDELETLLDEIYTYGIKNSDHFGEPIDKGGMIDYIRELISNRKGKEGARENAQKKDLLAGIE